MSSKCEGLLSSIKLLGAPRVQIGPLDQNPLRSFSLSTGNGMYTCCHTSTVLPARRYSEDVQHQHLCHHVRKTNIAELVLVGKCPYRKRQGCGKENATAVEEALRAAGLRLPWPSPAGEVQKEPG